MQFGEAQASGTPVAWCLLTSPTSSFATGAPYSHPPSLSSQSDCSRPPLCLEALLSSPTPFNQRIPVYLWISTANRFLQAALPETTSVHPGPPSHLAPTTLHGNDFFNWLPCSILWIHERDPICYLCVSSPPGDRSHPRTNCWKLIKTHPFP